MNLKNPIKGLSVLSEDGVSIRQIKKPALVSIEVCKSPDQTMLIRSITKQGNKSVIGWLVWDPQHIVTSKKDLNLLQFSLFGGRVIWTISPIGHTGVGFTGLTGPIGSVGPITTSRAGPVTGPTGPIGSVGPITTSRAGPVTGPTGPIGKAGP